MTKESILEEFEKLLREYGNGYYWKNEGWTSTHEAIIRYLNNN